MTNSLDHYLKLWNLREPERLAQTPTSDVYAVTRDGVSRNGERAVLKLLTPVGAEDEHGAVAALRYFDGHGAVRLLAHDDRAHLLEYAGDEELAEMVPRGADLAAAAVIAEVLNKLHRPRPDAPAPQLQTLRRRFRSLFRTAAQDEAAGVESIYVRGARVAERLLAQPQDECVLHGDIQHHNIRRHPARGWLAYDPKGLYGERAYDAANTLCNPANARDRVMSEARLLEVSQALADGMGVDVGRLRAFVFAHACLSASWPDKPEGSDIERWFLTVARNAERHADFAA
ncbi:MAG: 3'-kinase [Anaerolineae bacterium]|nr:3'-kinase [Anaerolineae bacterium]